MSSPAPKLRRTVQMRHFRALATLFVTSFLLAWVSRWLIGSIPLPTRLSTPPSTVVLAADGAPLHVFLAPDDRLRIAADPDTIDPDYITALLRFEDKRFEDHGGVDPFAVWRAAWLNLRHRRVVSGASTLTMQLVRVLEPRPRTLLSKFVEALRATQLELRLSKREILAAYLTFAPFGGNLEGVETASYAFFGHGAQDLTAAEITTLLAIPQRPEARRPSARNRTRLSAARNAIAEWLASRGALPGDTDDTSASEILAQVRATGVPERLLPLPRDAPHAARWLRARHPHTHQLESSLDRGTQRLAEELLARSHQRLTRLGIYNGAVVVADHDRGEVVALVGNPNFWDAEHGGQIAGFDVPRSPGSALKPFLYALAIDQGIALPEHLVPDVPRRWGGYAPENYDRTWSGLVELEEALSRSLNIPFVALLDRLGTERFVGTLRQLGASRLSAEPGRYGLSVALGGIEITPLELAALYSTLAADGHSRPLTALRHGDTVVPGTPWIAPGATELTRRALARRDRPDFPTRRRMTGVPPRVHWKTGTSYDHRDAWAAGSGLRYTAVVWLGNFDNRPSADLVGADAAGPLLFDLLEALEATSTAAGSHSARSPDLEEVEVCSLSGHRPSPACPTRRSALALRHRVPIHPCPYHVAVDLDLERGLALNPTCREGRQWERRTFVVWPAEVRRFLRASRRALPAPPALAPECDATSASRSLAILEPLPGQILMLVPGRPASDQEVALVADSAAGAELAWFVDGHFLGAVQAGEALWWTPSTGRHQLTVVGPAGESLHRTLQVRSRGE